MDEVSLDGTALLFAFGAVLLAGVVFGTLPALHASRRTGQQTLVRSSRNAGGAASMRLRRVLIVDLDVHQGDGTAAILAGDDDVHTLSLHGRNNFPFRKAASCQDVELDDRTSDTAYLATLRVALPLAIERSDADLSIYLAGADPYEHDRLGRLALTKDGLAMRDAYVLDTLRSAGIPVAITMAGGYAEDIDDVVDIHFATVRAALERFGDSPVLDSPDASAPLRTAMPATSG